MKQIAVLGTEGAGKTVFVTCLAKKLQGKSAAGILEPTDLETQRYVERAWQQLLSGDWPPATTPGQIPVLNWKLRFGQGAAMPFQVVDPPGHDLRRLFAQDGRLEKIPGNLQSLAQTVSDASIILLLVNLGDLVGEGDGERRLVTELVIKFVLDSLLRRSDRHPPDVALVLTQCDLFPQEVVSPRSPRAAVEKYLPLVAQSEAFHALVAGRIFPVAAINKTQVVVDDDGRARRVPDRRFQTVGFAPLIEWMRDRPPPAPRKETKAASAPKDSPASAHGMIGFAISFCLAFFVLRGCIRAKDPSSQIVTSQAKYVYGLLDHAVTVSGQVRNAGTDGSVTVYAAVHDGRSLWKHSTSLSLPAGATAPFEIEFAEWQSGDAWFHVTADPQSLEASDRFQPVPR